VLKVTIDHNITKFSQDLRNMPIVIQKLALTAMFRAASLVEAEAKNNLRGRVLNVQSGSLFNSIQKKVGIDSDGNVFSDVFSTGVPYAKIHEFGGLIPAHFVAPRNKKALHWQSGGKDFFSKGHMIPDIEMPERSYLRSALTAAAPRIEQMFASIPELAFERI